MDTTYQSTETTETLVCGYQVEAGSILSPAVEAGVPHCADVKPADEAAGGIHLTDHQLAKAKARHTWLRGVREYFALGYSMNQAVSQFPQFSLATLSRLLSLAEAALGPQSTAIDRADWLLAQPLQFLVPGVTSGRRPIAPLMEQEALALRGLVLARSTQNDHTTANHFSLAVEEFIRHPACTSETRSFILQRLDEAAQSGQRPAWPDAWRKAAYPTRQEAAKFRGRKSEQPLDHVDRRAMIWTDEDGADHPVVAHTIWEMDDASDNEPRVSIDPDTGLATVTRQTLWTQDVYSAAVLGFSQVARARDAYRIEDVADHVRNCIQAWGLPTFLRLEQGKIWNGSFFHGISVASPGWSRDEKWGGLEPLVRIVNVFKSKGKGAVEKSFDLLQAMQAHSGLSLGRVRGEYEVATKALTRAHGTGQIDDRFAALDEAADRTAAVCEWFNARPKTRREFGRTPVVPADLLRGAKGPQPPASEAWRLCPIKRLATVRGGHVEIMVDHYPQSFRFRVNGEQDLHLDHGYAVLVAFHPGRPEEGCHVFNAETGPRNRDNLKRGEFLLVAPMAADVPQIDLSGRADFAPRKKAAAAVRRSFRAIAQAVRATHTQDSNGTVQRAEVGMTAPQPVAGSEAAAAQPKPRREPNPFRCAGEEDWAAQRARNERMRRAMEAVEALEAGQ